MVVAHRRPLIRVVMSLFLEVQQPPIGRVNRVMSETGPILHELAKAQGRFSGSSRTYLTWGITRLCGRVESGQRHIHHQTDDGYVVAPTDWFKTPRRRGRARRNGAGRWPRER